MEITDGYIWKENQRLRCGYTTGSCAAAAAKACMLHLLTGKPVETVELMTPKGILLKLKPENRSWLDEPKKCAEKQPEKKASCAIRKDGGDDFDMTHGLLIFADVELTGRTNPEDQADRTDLAGQVPVFIDGGEGVGRVTKKGLDQPVGNAAVNSVPRRMITEAVCEAAKACRYTGGVRVTIRVPGGEKVAEKTFNPRLGIVGGISILGTSGIVVPMSEEALVDSIRAEIRLKLADGTNLLALTPGNYGESFAGRQYGISPDKIVICSNYIGKALDMAAEEGAKELLLIGHIGKFIKLSGGIMNTHSREADSRLELLTAAALGCGCQTVLCKEILACNTTEEALEVLEQAGRLTPVCERVREQAEYYAAKRLRDAFRPAVILFSQERGLLAASKRAETMAGKLSLRLTL